MAVLRRFLHVYYTFACAYVICLCMTEMTNIIMYHILDLYRSYFPSLPMVVGATLLNLCRWFSRPFRWCQKGEDKYDHALIGLPVLSRFLLLLSLMCALDSLNYCFGTIVFALYFVALWWSLGLSSSKRENLLKQSRVWFWW